MVFINMKKYKTYDLDTIHTFKIRLAAEMKTLPEYLLFSSKVTLDILRNKKSELKVRNILSEINKIKDTKSLSTLIMNNPEIKQDIIKAWVAFNKSLDKQINKGNTISLTIIGQELVDEGIYITISQFDQIWKEKKTLQKSIQESIEYNQTQANNIKTLFRQYSRINEDDTIVYTNFRIEEISFILTLNLHDMPLLELFDAIVLDETSSFATTKNFYKILEDYIPPEEWERSSDDSIIMKVTDKKITRSNSDHIDVVFRSDLETKNISVEIMIKSEKNTVPKNIFVNRIFNTLPSLDIKIEKTEENLVKGMFYLPSFKLNKYVFADLVLNDELFSMLMSIDDSDKVTKKKSGTYVHFNHPSTGYITATFTEKNVGKNDPILKLEDHDFFDVGESYIRVRISKAKNIKSIEIFRKIISRLFAIYNQKYNNIANFYTEYIPNFGSIIIEEKEDDIRQTNYEQAPDLFISKYTRNCNQQRMPTIINKKEAKNRGKNVIKFPRDIPTDLNIPRFPTDGKNQHYYTCNNPKYKYIGLKENKLRNADIYPYVPCCFLTDQKNKDKIRYYYEGKEITEKKDKMHDIIRTNKILSHIQFGKLPQNIEYLFSLIQANPQYEYARKGVFRNEQSFLNCVMEALDDETNILGINDKDEKEAMLVQTREKLATKILAPLCRQELYDMTVDEIIEELKNPDIYLDPKRYIHLLEDYYECNIFIFTKRTINGVMILPRHVQAYYRNKTNNRRCIYIYEHMGSESDRATYPQCELIIKYNIKTGKSQYLFTYEESLEIRKLYLYQTRAYALNKLIREINFPFGKLNIKSQIIDVYGKTRCLNIKFKNELLSIMTSPMHQ